MFRPLSPWLDATMNLELIGRKELDTSFVASLYGLPVAENVLSKTYMQRSSDASTVWKTFGIIVI